MTVKEIRCHTNLSQAEFAKKYNIPISTVEKWESGIKSPPKSMLSYIKFQVAKDYPHIRYFISEEDKL